MKAYKPFVTHWIQSMMTYPSVAACLEIVGPKKVVTSLAHGVLPLVDDCHLFASGKVDGYQHAGFICFLSLWLQVGFEIPMFFHQSLFAGSRKSFLVAFN